MKGRLVSYLALCWPGIRPRTVTVTPVPLAKVFPSPIGVIMIRVDDTSCIMHHMHIYRTQELQPILFLAFQVESRATITCCASRKNNLCSVDNLCDTSSLTRYDNIHDWSFPHEFTRGQTGCGSYMQFMASRLLGGSSGGGCTASHQKVLVLGMAQTTTSDGYHSPTCD